MKLQQSFYQAKTNICMFEEIRQVSHKITFVKWIFDKIFFRQVDFVYRFSTRGYTLRGLSAPNMTAFYEYESQVYFYECFQIQQ